MKGFQAKNVTAIRSDRVVCVVKVGAVRAKAFQVFFGKDGSLFVTFPYFRHRTGILSSCALPANGAEKSEVSLEAGGKVTSHLVKYSHHPDGRAHFSQTGKIVTAVKRQSIALDKQHGHIFSLIIQGLSGLEPAHPIKDVSSATRSVVDFEVDPSDAIRFVARWFDVSRMRFSNPTITIGPIVPLEDPDGITRTGCIIASPHANAKHVLALTCASTPRLGPEPEMFVFYGGFDPPELMVDSTKDAGFLIFVYPVSAAEKVKERIGSVDYIPRT
jgi:hypothetical protein